MEMLVRCCVTLSATLALAAPALAQHVPFTRTFDVGGDARDDDERVRGTTVAGIEGPRLRAADGSPFSLTATSPRAPWSSTTAPGR